MRLRLARAVPAKPWDESRQAYAPRLKRVREDIINSTLDVEGLCRAFLRRAEEKLVANKGGRLSE